MAAAAVDVEEAATYLRGALAFIDGMPMWQRPSGAPAADDLPLFSAAG